MKPTEGSPTSAEDDAQQLDHVRELLLGKERQQIKDVLNDNAREIVGSVVIEAIHDRQKKDDGLSTVLVPLVERSVEKSVKSHSDQFIGYLYPLVGRLVRKSVTAFLTEFLEKTNELLENSLTFKGIAWRFKAWQAGVSYSQYVASKTFAFRVEQVLLIHHETGILLNTVSHSTHQTADADMVSGMLTAINDFVSDSFTLEQQQQNIAEVKTEDFTLRIARGPQLMLVAAITGNAPSHVSKKLQITIEQIHRLYASELAEFNGDTQLFENTESQLRECLLAELKEPVQEHKKTPWLAISLVLIIIGLLIYWGIKEFQQHSLAENLKHIESQPGILIREMKSQGMSNIQLSILRDPSAIQINQWLQDNGINPANVIVKERQYLSLEPELVAKKVNSLILQYPELQFDHSSEDWKISGKVANGTKQQLIRDLSAIPGLNNISRLVENVVIEELETQTMDNPELLAAMLRINSARIDVTQIEFEQGESQLTEQAKDKLIVLSDQIKSVIDISQKLELNVGLIIMGASDSSGSKQFNQDLSIKRAEAAQKYLISLGVDPGYLNPIGLGVVELKAVGSGVRKVIFNLVEFENQ